MTLRTKDQFRNDSPGQVGVTVIENGKERGIALRPGDTIWLSEEEQELTANAPRKDENNPFIGGNPNGGPALRLLIKAGEMGNRRPLGGAQKPEGENGQPEGAQTVSEDEQRERQIKAKAAAERQAQSEETGAAKPPAGKPPEGRRAPREEVGTPEAPAKA